MEIKHRNTGVVLWRGASLRGANLRGVNLRNADLHGVNLYGADLRDANLRGASLYGANLGHANLGDADLCDADLRGVDLCGADLRGANLHGADLGRANLYGADLRGASLYNVDLGDANLCDADLGGADLRDADLRDAKLSAYSLVPEGDFVAFKALQDGIIAKLRIPAIARRVSTPVGRKCRAEFVEVLELSGSVACGYSQYDAQFCYRVGETVKPVKPFNDDFRTQCASGIHFFITRKEAEEYSV